MYSVEVHKTKIRLRNIVLKFGVYRSFLKRMQSCFAFEKDVQTDTEL